MSDYHRPPGKTTVSPEVLIVISRMAALSIPGVSSLAPVADGVNRLFRRRTAEGVRISIIENVIYGDIYLIVKSDVNIREVCRNVQTQVARAIQEMVGMDVAEIDVHVEDIDHRETEV